MNKPKLTSTLAEAKDWLREQIREGAICPCCNQLAKIYKRRINGSAVSFLIKMYKLRKFQPTHITSFLGEQKMSASYMADTIRLHHWNLIEEVENMAKIYAGAKANGYWKITELGEQFILGQKRIPKYILLYNNTFLGNDTNETVNVYETLGKKFNYTELMNA